MVMVVDDRFDEVHNALQLLKQESLRLLPVIRPRGAGEEAVRVAKERRPKLVIMDIDLGTPGIDGVEAVRQMRQFQPKLPVIFRTVLYPPSSLWPELQPRLRQLEPYDVVPKIAPAGDLVDAVHRRLSPLGRRNKIFICYSHIERRFMNELKGVLDATFGTGKNYFVDILIDDGEDWRHKIVEALETAAAGVLLVSPSFCRSSFIQSEELPRLLKAADQKELALFPIMVCSTPRPALKRVGLENRQFSFPPERAFAEIKRRPRERLWTQLAEHIAAKLDELF